MNYELAKELKEVGWPQTTVDGDSYFRNDGKLWKKSLADHTGDDDMLDCPTLSQLIEACGDNFCELKRDYHTGKWTAQSYKFHGFDNLIVMGLATPEEAVTRLWLALNKK